MLVWDELNRPWIEHWGIPQKKDPELLVLNHLILRLILKKIPSPRCSMYGIFTNIFPQNHPVL